MAKGRCETCEGEGFVMVELLFLPSVYAPCPTCHGARYNAQDARDPLQGRNIAEVLGMTVDEAWEFFAGQAALRRALKCSGQVGLGYLRLGQPATELSGGEAQRIKLATELQRSQRGDTLYVLDEPTTGLHPADVERLMAQLDGLVDAGNTVIVVEQRCVIVAGSDWVIDVGPAPARKEATSLRPEPRPWLRLGRQSNGAGLARFLGTPDGSCGRRPGPGERAPRDGLSGESLGEAAPFIEDDQPPAIPLPSRQIELKAPVRVRCRIPGRCSGRACPSRHLDHIRLPGEGRVWLLEDVPSSRSTAAFPRHHQRKWPPATGESRKPRSSALPCLLAAKLLSRRRGLILLQG